MRALIPLNDLFSEPGPQDHRLRLRLQDDRLLTISTLLLGSPVMGV